MINSLLKFNKIDFKKDIMNLYIVNGRILSVPVSKFPDIKKLNNLQRKAYHISAGISLDFDDSDEVYHINELLGIDLI